MLINQHRFQLSYSQLLNIVSELDFSFFQQRFGICIPQSYNGFIWFRMTSWTIQVRKSGGVCSTSQQHGPGKPGFHSRWRNNIFSHFTLDSLDPEEGKDRCDSNPDTRIREVTTWANAEFGISISIRVRESLRSNHLPSSITELRTWERFFVASLWFGKVSGRVESSRIMIDFFVS